VIYLVDDTMRRFGQIFGSEPEVVATAPGRVNLIGEHTDYNGGFVLPMAIDRRIIVAAGRRDDRALHLHTVDLQTSVTADLDALTYRSDALWANFPLGVASILRGGGGSVLGGANILIRGDIPIGAGLSSSAALEVASAIALAELNGVTLSPLDLAKLACEAERKFVRVQCGIMDQFIAVMGKRDHVLFLDCSSYQYEHFPFVRGAQLVICDTGVRRELALTDYNRREAECDEAVRQLGRLGSTARSLREVSSDELGRLQKQLTPTARKRAQHVVSENQRVLQMIAAMEENDLESAGRLMTASHRSLQRDYEVSCHELDTFVDIATQSPGVYGARMTGAGFGGSAICLVAREEVDPLMERLRAEYPRRAGKSLTIYLMASDDGASVMLPRLSRTPVLFAERSG
jgi:galactokinase